ncbi:MAG: T9SS type A sorting domain-containing protein [candidate division WOR-3 bacterium]
MKRIFLIIILTLGFSVGGEFRHRQVKPDLKEGRRDRSKAQIFSPFSLIRQKRPQRLPHNPGLQLEEFLLDTTRTFGPAPGDQEFCDVGFDGTNYFVVWLDDRAQEEDYRIYGARVTTAGVVLDTNGIQIAQYLSTYPAVRFDSTNYLVVWTDIRSGYEADIYAARVTTSGEVLDPQGIPVSTAEADQWLPAMIFDGAGYFTVWADYRNGNEDIYGARVTPAGVVLDPNGILLDYGYSSPEQYAPAVAFDGSNYLVVWEDYRKGYAIYGARVTPAGVVLDPQGIPISSDSLWRYAPAVAFDGTNYFVVWSDMRNGDYDIYGARVTPAGVVLDPDGIAIATGEYDQYVPSIAFDGTNYLVAWSDYRNGYESDIYGARVTPAGVVLDTSGIAVSTAPNGQYAPAIGFDGTNYLIVWSDYRSGEWGDIYGARVTTAGSVLEPQGIRIAIAENEQWSPRVAYDGTNYLVVFQDDRDGDFIWDVYGTRVRPDGVALDSEGIAISTAEFDQIEPRVAFDGTNYLVVWTDYRNEWGSDIYGARVTPAGVVLDTEGIELINQPDDRFTPDIGKGPGSQLLLTFGGYVPLYGVSKVFGALYQGIGINEKGAGKGGFTFRVLTNPIRRNGRVELTLTRESEVKLELVDVTGRLVKTVAAGRLGCGTHQIRLDCQSIQTGVYFLRCAAGEKSLIKKVTNIR